MVRTMNSLGFLGLVTSFYMKKLPDLKKIQNKGLLAVKIAQHYALRVDFLSEEMCTHLSKLYTHSFPAREQTLSDIIKDRSFLDEHFSSWDERPFSSASVGQVHKGVLKSGERVAIKVIRENFEKPFLKDLKNIEDTISIIGKLWPKFNKIFNPIGILENIKRYTLEELDLTHESRDIEKLRSIQLQYSRSFDLNTLDFPRIYPMSNSKIMVSDLLEGETFDTLLENGDLKYEILIELFRLHSFYIFKVGTFHGDLHPGNIFLADNKIYLIDCAGLSIISKRLQKGLFWFFYYLSRYDYENAARYLNLMSLNSLTEESYDSFLKKFNYLYRDFKGASVEEVSLTKRMMETIKLGINSGMDFGDDMFPVIKSLMYLDGMVMKCNPSAVLMEDVRDFTDYLLLHIDDFKP